MIYVDISEALSGYFSIILLHLSFTYCSKIVDNCNLQINSFLPDLISNEHSIYNIDSSIQKKIQNSVKQKFFRDELNVWKILAADSTKHYAILDNVKGKSMPITFLTILIIGINY